MTRIVLHIRDTISLEALGHSVAVQERMLLTFNWWLMLLCPAFSPTCDLAFPSSLCSLPSWVVEGTTVSRKTSLSNFKRAQFPSKTCTRTDYPCWLSSSRAQLIYLFCIHFFTLLQHCHHGHRKTGRTLEWNFESPSLCSALLNVHQRNMDKICTVDCHKIAQSPDREPSLDYYVYKVEKTITTRFKHWVHEAPWQVEEWEMAKENECFLFRESYRLVHWRRVHMGPLRHRKKKTLEFLLRFYSSSFQISFLCFITCISINNRVKHVYISSMTEVF